MSSNGVDEDDVVGTNEVKEVVMGTNEDEEDVKMSDSEEEEGGFSDNDIMELVDNILSSEKPEPSSKNDKASTSTAMELEDEDDDDEEDERVEEVAFTEEGLSKLCREASRSFFKEYGLLSHQIHSYNDFVENGVQKVFDDIGEIDVEPGYDPSKKGGDGGWRRAKVKFGKVKLEKPMFWSNDSGKALKFLPRHARLQHMTYSSRMKVEIDFECWLFGVASCACVHRHFLRRSVDGGPVDFPLMEVFKLENKSSDKFKTGKETYTQKVGISEEKKEVVIGRIPVMVGSNLCWMNGKEKDDCEFDHGGYFVVKGAEKAFVAQERISLKRLWVFDQPNWNISYRTEIRRLRVDLKIEEVSASECEHLQRTKVLNVHFLGCTIPLWVFLFSLGMPSDKEIIEMIDCNLSDESSVKLLLSTISYADDRHEGFRRGGYSSKKIDELIKGTRFPPKESTRDCLDKYLFPTLTRSKQKALFLGYMVKRLLQSYSGQGKPDNKDDFRNKRLDLAGELLERELRNHIKHAERRMVKAMQRDLYGERSLRQIEHYLDASLITNGLTKAFSTGAWSHHFKYSEKINGVVANLRRTNPLQTMCDMRKTRQHVQYSGKVGDARFPHPSHWGKLCFLSTSDGENCGLVKNMAITGIVSTNLIQPLLGILLVCGMEKLSDDLSPLSLKGKNKIFLNGEWVGVCRDSLSLVNTLKRKRRSKEVPPQVEIKRDQQQEEVRIFTDSGRIPTPFWLLKI
ncbi:hypothetical protein IFM89_001735 [Coptis chinensis]|uniref:DNA-directed RNA polymerase n=1 Tax=Coptis chinensis TaxID=261450 RepID=A0A835HHZ0_9MAGN|nr:hypothetical protein IFM89_001735 [Coptis chinensis]